MRGVPGEQVTSAYPGYTDDWVAVKELKLSYQMGIYSK